jgi:hypothetical protein
MKKAILLILVTLASFSLSVQAQKHNIMPDQSLRQLSRGEVKLKYKQISHLQSFAREVDNIRGIVFEEHFDSDELPADWTALCQGWDYIYCYDSTLNFFKQSEGDDPMILSTPSIDLSTVTKMDFDMASFPQNDGIAIIQVGTMSDPNDASTFVLIDEYIPLKYESHTFTLILGAFSNTTHISFRLIGLPWDYVTLDNVVMYDDIVIAKAPVNVSDLQLQTGTSGEMYAHFIWTNPTKQQDGFDLETLDSVVIVSGGISLYTLTNPVIGGQEDVTFNVPEAGFYRFTVIPYNIYGKGFMAPTANVWIGIDQPGQPQNAFLVKSGNISSLSWSPPVAGAHGYFFDGVIDHYEIMRADSLMFTVAGDVTSLSDTVNIPGTFNYTITPYNASGMGLGVATNAAQFLSDGYLVYEDFWVDPIFEGFWSSNETNWTTWPYIWAGGHAGELVCNFYPTFQGQTRAISPVINTTGLSTLALEFRKYCESYTGNPFVFKIETTSDGGNTWNLVYSWDVTVTQPAEYIKKSIHTTDVGSPNFQVAFTFDGNTDDINVVAIDDVRLYSSTAINIAYVSNDMASMIEPQEVITPEVKIENIGSEVSPYEATFMLKKGTEEVYKSVKTGQIQIGVTDSITFDSWTSVEGEYIASVKIICNGDADTLNNSTAFEMNVYSLMNREMVLLEEGTGTWCTYCPGAAMGIDDLITQGYKVAAIAYHSGDNYETTEGRARLDAYQVTGFPTVYFDGPEAAVIGGDHDLSMVEYYKPEVDSRMNNKTPLKIEFSGLLYNNDTRTITGNIHVTSLSSINNPRLHIFQVITESDIDESWQGQSKLNFVERTMSPSGQGTPINMAGKEVYIPVQITLDPAWNAQNCELIVFLQDTLTQEVFTTMMITMPDANGISDISWGGSVNVRPNPANDYCTVSITLTAPEQVIIKLYNPNGQLIRTVNDSYLQSGSHEIKIDLNGLSTGLYLLNISNGTNNFAKKIYHKRS